MIISFSLHNSCSNKMCQVILTKPKITMLTIKEAAALVEGLTEYRVRQMCINNQIPHIMAGKKYLINRNKFLSYLRGETV
jgi:excisionase family DNA binding protein